MIQKCWRCMPPLNMMLQTTWWTFGTRRTRVKLAQLMRCAARCTTCRKRNHKIWKLPNYYTHDVRFEMMINHQHHITRFDLAKPQRCANQKNSSTYMIDSHFEHVLLLDVGWWWVYDENFFDDEKKKEKNIVWPERKSEIKKKLRGS